MNPASRIRPPAVAGSFYPADPALLSRDVESMLAAASPSALPALRALVVPHAGYVYSGPIAASAYALLRAARPRIRRVALFGPAHRVAVEGLAIPQVDAFATPLGTVPLDAEALTRALRLPQVVVSNEAHAMEHSLEVQLPFLQSVLDEFEIAPFLVGRAAAADVAAVIDALWQDDRLIVISSDLSHYLGYRQAQAMDRRSVDAMMELRPLEDYEQACGATPINGLLSVARRRGLAPHLLDLRNSGDTAGDRSRVVGYSALAFCESPRDGSAESVDDLGEALLVRARNAIAGRLGEPPRPETADARLAQPGATFVTLTQDGSLRGCMGSLEAKQALDEDVRANARAAAFRDPRFEPLRHDELARTRVEVSLLSAAEPLSCADEEEARRLLRPGRDGVILEYGHRRSTFLPQVWQSLAEPQRFLAELKRKAGLPADFWHPDLRLWRYEVQKWKEQP